MVKKLSEKKRALLDGENTGKIVETIDTSLSSASSSLSWYQIPKKSHKVVLESCEYLIEAKIYKSEFEQQYTQLLRNVYNYGDNSNYIGVGKTIKENLLQVNLKYLGEDCWKASQSTSTTIAKWNCEHDKSAY